MKNLDFIKKTHVTVNDEGVSVGESSHESYLLRCLESLDRSLPILDKICNKTLCLQNYRVSDGHCTGLAEACRLLDHKVVNRLLLQNCGISGG